MRFGHYTDDPAYIDWLTGYVHAVDERRSACRLQKTVEHADGRCFPGSVRAEKSENVALTYLEIKPIHGFEAVFVDLSKAVRFDHDCAAFLMREGRSRMIMKANAARKLKNSPRIGQSDLFMPSFTASL